MAEMRRVVGLALLLALLATGSASAGVPHVPRGWIGVNADDLITADPAGHAREWRLMGSTGVRTVRAAFYWPTLQPQPGPVDFSSTDRVVRAAATNRMRVLAIVNGSPPWAAKDLDPGKGVASPPRDPQDYVALLRTLIARYGPSGRFWAENPALPRRPIRVWQIWNEPNLPVNWSEQPFAAGYVKLLRAAHKAVHKADPGATVLMAGLPNRSWADLRTLYAHGARGSFDALAVHPYTKRVPDLVRIVRRVRAVQRRYKDARRPLWLTEMCWPASAPRGGQPFEGQPFETDNQGQASKLGKAVRLLAAGRRRYNIAGVLWYTWHSQEDSTIPAFWPSFCGLRRVNVRGHLVSEPALRTFRNTIRALTR